MPLHDILFTPLIEDEGFARLLGGLREGKPAAIAGLVESSKALLLHLLRRLTGRPIVLIVPDEMRLDEYARDLSAFARMEGGPAAAGRVVRIPALGADPYQGIPPHLGASMERVAALATLATGSWDFLLVSSRALLTPLPPPERMKTLCTRVHTGEKLELGPFVARAIAGGYRREEMVGSQGEISQRGGIVDIFPPRAPAPFRIELAGDVIASIRSFDPDTQRSLETAAEVELLPVVEAPLGEAERERLAIAAALWADRLPEGAEGRSWRARLESLQEGVYAPGSEALTRVFLASTADLMAYAPGAIRAVDEPSRAAEELLATVSELEASSRASPGCPLPPPGEFLLDPAALVAQIGRSDLKLTELRVAGEATIGFASQPARNYGGRVLDFIRDLAGHRRAGRRVAVLVATKGTRDRLGEILTDYGVTFRAPAPEPVSADVTAPPSGRPGTRRGIVRGAPGSASSLSDGPSDAPDPTRDGAPSRPPTRAPLRSLLDRGAMEPEGEDGEIDPDLVVTSWRPGSDLDEAQGQRPDRRGLDEGEPRLASRPSPVPEIPSGEPIVLIDCGLNHGFVLTDIGLVVVTEREIFGEEVRTVPAKRRKGAAFISDFRDLKPGDLVVHVDHGVGRYQGLARPPASPRDFMLLQYADDARLYVPVDRLDLVQKYGAGDGASRSLDKLGGPGWERVKGRVRKAVRDMTKELLELYATRKAIAGRPFSADTAWQREFEDGFPFVLTPDQERAIAEVKADMESEKPMERLLCGDVGYGKTEVAMRAAFKAVQDGAQAAVLAPTTVLALQHWRTFRERFAPFPVTVEMLSRLRSPREQKEVVARLAEGKVDILIGTQRLLSRDVVFRELGLLIVDEEQRFGVAHKERLKQISVGIDTLAMSATPIPRTLQMSMAGVRDLSVIETPPMNRLAIQTNLLPYKRETVAAAIRSELHRGGQVYFVHNRVESIHRIAARIQELVPEARFAVTHGQMDARSLEGTMVRFLRGEVDVLVSTTIIENGLDIPRVNTLIVNRADRFGLSQLYQLRGRVGRSDVRAYSYFIVPSRRTLTPLARRRLLALQEFSDLGAGFRIAALDLELRGAGDLLGARQHGHIAALGFDLYMKMLEEAVREYEGAAPTPEAATFNLGVDIRIPDSYVPEPNLRLALYKRIASAHGGEELAEIRAEVEDRFGKLPRSGANLFDLAVLRLEAGGLGVRTVEFAEGRLAFRFIDQPAVSPERVIRFLGRQGFASISPTGLLSVPAPPDPEARIEAARVVLQGLAG